MSVATFPYTAAADAPHEGYSIAPVWSTSIVTSQSGMEQRRSRVTYPRHKITGLKWGRDENASLRVDTLYGFYNDCNGAALPFAFIDFPSHGWGSQYVGVGNGGSTVWDLPSYGGASFTIKVNGIPKSSPGDYSISAGAGSNGRDRIVFTAAPAAGYVIRAWFTGRRVFVVRFLQDEISFQSFSASIFEIGLDLLEVKGEG